MRYRRILTEASNIHPFLDLKYPIGTSDLRAPYSPMHLARSTLRTVHQIIPALRTTRGLIEDTVSPTTNKIHEYL